MTINTSCKDSCWWSDPLKGDPLKDALAEIERLQALLNGRDTFIVDCGLWSDFLATLPRDNEQSALVKMVDGVTPENRHPETRT